MSNNSLKPVNNEICAYRNCTKKSQVRLNFALGFSARFCSVCATELADAKIGALEELNDE